MTSAKIALIDYGIGNVGSVKSACEFYGYDVSLVREPHRLKSFDLIILAGVGNFSTAVEHLKQTGFWSELNNLVSAKKKPLLGICLGMQVFAEMGYEDGENKGFGWLKGKVVKIEDKSVRVPHIGWDKVKSLNRQLFKKMRYRYFYFMHSYHFVPDDPRVIAGVTHYGHTHIVSAVKKDNLVGVQFHPEKSQGDGLRFLRNTIEFFS